MTVSTYRNIKIYANLLVANFFNVVSLFELINNGAMSTLHKWAGILRLYFLTAERYHLFFTILVYLSMR